MNTAVNSPDPANLGVLPSILPFSVSVFSISALPKSPFSPATPFSLATGSLNGLNPKSKFLAIERFSKLLQVTRPALRAHLSTKLRCREAVEDCLQEIALTVWQKYDEGWDEESFRRYSFTCARFKALSWLKKNKSNNLVVMAPEMAERLADRIESLGSGGDGEAKTETDRIMALENCVDGMPQRQRELLMSRYGPKEGGTLEEQARKLSLSMDAVYKQLERLRTALRDCVEQRLKGA